MTTHLESDLYLWPRCARCNKPVETLEYRTNPIRQEDTWIAHCHGETDALVISHRRLREMSPGLRPRVVFFQQELPK